MLGASGSRSGEASTRRRIDQCFQGVFWEPDLGGTWGTAGVLPCGEAPLSLSVGGLWKFLLQQPLELPLLSCHSPKSPDCSPGIRMSFLPGDGSSETLLGARALFLRTRRDARPQGWCDEDHTERGSWF